MSGNGLMKFLFRLQKLLEWKKSLEEQSKLILLQKNEELKRKEEEIRKLIEIRIQQSKVLEEKLKRGLEGTEYLIYQQFNERCYNDLKEQNGFRNDKEEEVKRELKNLLILIKERKILEKFKEKRFKKFINQQEREEQKFIDLLTIRRHFLNDNERN